MKKKPLKIFIYLLLVLPILFAGCQKSELVDNSASSTANTGSNPVKSNFAYTPCGWQLVANLYEYGNTTNSYGTLTLGNDADYLYLTYELNPGGSWLINGALYYVGPAEGLPLNSLTNNGYELYGPDFTRNWFSYTYAHTERISLSNLPECFVVVAFAYIREGNVSGKYVSAKTSPTSGLKAYSGYYLEYCKRSCGNGCETGYAFGNSFANCYLTIPGVTSNNWGWSNGPIGAGIYNWPIYAGAGQCNISNGTFVGTLNVNYTPPTAIITYNMGGSHLYATHLHVGNTILPVKKNGKYTTAPGQFPYKHENLMGVNYDSFTISGLSGQIYIAAHSDVCW